MPGAVAEWTLQGSVPPATPAAPRIEHLSFSGCSVLVGVAVFVEVSSEFLRNVKLRAHLIFRSNQDSQLVGRKKPKPG